MGALLTDSLRGHSPLTSIQIVLANLTRNPSFLPSAVIASQTLFFGVQALAAWRQLRFMGTTAYRGPVGVDLQSEDAKVYLHRVKQNLIVNVLERAAWCGVTIAQALGGWNVLWGISLSAGHWYEQRFRSRHGYLVANPVFYVLDYATSLAASLIVKNLYLAYNAPQIYPETSRLSFFARLKRHMTQSWNTDTRRMWFKTIVPYVLPLLSLVPGIIAATRVQYRLERGMIVSFKRTCWEMSKVALLILTLTGVLGASIPSILGHPEEPVNKDTPDLPSWAIEQCLISDLGERGIRLKGTDGEQPLDLIKVESLVAQVIRDTAYEGEVKIALRFDTELRDKDERALAFVPRLFLGTLTLSSQQFALFTDKEMRALIATALQPGFQNPFNIKNYIFLFFASALPLVADPLMYSFFRQEPQMFDGLVPALRSRESIIPLPISMAVSQALLPWSVYLMKPFLRRVKSQTYRNDALIASLSPDYAQGWAGVLSKHTVFNHTIEGQGDDVQDYGRTDAFFDFWCASHGKNTVQPALLQRLERLEHFSDSQ